MRNNFILVLKYFLIWRVVLFLLAASSGYLIPHFGASFPYYDRVLQITGLPNWIWGFGNFDGVHYLRIAQNGYTSEFTNAFFPLYPLLVRLVSVIFPKTQGLDLTIYTDPLYFYTGFILSNCFFIFALYFFYKLLRLDFSETVSKKSLIFLLAFPTAYYFGSVYTESLFLFLAAISIYLIRKQKYFFSSVFIALATATRVVGVFLILIYLIELVKNRESLKFKTQEIFGFVIAPLGLVGYSLYLNSKFGDFFYFLSVQPKFGADRSSSLILLPQVFYRYLKIIFDVPVLSLSFFNAFWS